MPMDRTQQSETVKSPMVLSIECLKGSSKADEWTKDMLQTGDIVEELQIGTGPGSGQVISAPFKGGKSGVQRILHSSSKKKETWILVLVRRGSDEFAELQACIVPNESAGKKQYMLRSIGDPNYTIGFSDRSEAECLDLQASRTTRMVSELSRIKLQDRYVGYSWEKKMQEMLSIPNSSCFLSMLFLPKISNQVATQYNDLEDTLARANAWLNASQAIGVPIVFINIQTESLLTKISGETASSTVNAGLSDLSKLTNVSLYGFEDYHGVDIGVVRAVRLWYTPIGEEFAIEIMLKEDDSKLGFAIGRTEEGFIYVCSVVDNDESTPSTRSGLSDLYKEAKRASKLLVVSRVSNQKVLPWMVSSTGAIKCFDTVSISHKLSLHRLTKVPILIHVFLWDKVVASSLLPIAANTKLSRVVSPPPVFPLPPEIRLPLHLNDNQVLPLLSEDEQLEGNELGMREEVGESSFRFQEFSIPNNLV